MATQTFPPISKMSNEDLRRLGSDQLIHILRQIDTDRIQHMRDHSKLMKDVNQKMQTHLMEIRSLKEVNKRLQDENQEVRDLVCFLDDDRQKGRKVAREWQKFGRYTSGVMKSELTQYQEKLQELEVRQEDMLRENMELKELCIYLDDEFKRSQSGDSLDRDDGDGSSSSSPTGEKIEDVPAAVRVPEQKMQNVTQPTVHLNEKTLQYIRDLERKVSQLEGGKQLHYEKNAPLERKPEMHKYFSSPQLTRNQETEAGVTQQAPRSRPESVVRAMQVLKVQEQLSVAPPDMGDTEQAIIRQMCNVVWKKLEDN